MTQLFTNKVALVTGGGIGSGRAITECYAREGAEELIVSYWSLLVCLERGG